MFQKLKLGQKAVVTEQWFDKIKHCCFCKHELCWINQKSISVLKNKAKQKEESCFINPICVQNSHTIKSMHEKDRQKKKSNWCQSA